MLTRRTLIATGACASALPLLPSFNALAQSSGPTVSTKPVPLPYFSPLLADFLAKSGAEVTTRMENSNLSAKHLHMGFKLMSAAADHVAQTSLDTVLAQALAASPSSFQPKHLANSIQQGVTAYQKYDPAAKIHDLSYVQNLTDAQIDGLTKYAARVGVSGVLRDSATTLYRAAHMKQSLGLRDLAFNLDQHPMLLDGLYLPGHAHLHRACSVPGLQKAKKVLCSTGTAVVNDTVGVILASLAVACLPAVLPEITAAAPPVGVALGVACGALSINPGLSIAAVTGLATVLIGTLRDIVC